MRSSIATSFLGMFILIAAACDESVIVPREHRPSPTDHTEIAGTYEGTVQQPGTSLTQAGSAALIVNQTAGGGISGDMILEARFSDGTETISLAVNSTYTGDVFQEGTTRFVQLRLDNPVCGGTTEFTGTYGNEHFTLSGQYVLKDADGCRTITTLDLVVSLDKSP